MARLIYQHASDNVASLGAWSVFTGTEDPGYLLANLYDRNPAKPFKLTGTSGRIVVDFTAARSIELAAIFNHNFKQSLSVKIEGNATNTWGAPTLSQSFVLTADKEDLMPVNPWLDLSAIVGHSFRYWSFLFGTNDEAIAVGDIWLGATKRSLPVNIHWGLEEKDNHPIIEHRTNYGVSTVYDIGTRFRTIIGEVETTDTGADGLQTFHRDCRGRALPGVVILDPAVSDARFVRWLEPDLAVKRNFKNSNIVQLKWEELSIGLPLKTPA